MAASSQHVRIRLRFVNDSVEPSWMLVDFKNVKTIYDLKKIIDIRFTEGNARQMKLTMLDCVLPDWETTQILQNGDTVLVLLEDGECKSTSMSDGPVNVDFRAGENFQPDSEEKENGTPSSFSREVVCMEEDSRRSKKSKKKLKKENKRKRKSSPVPVTPQKQNDHLSVGHVDEEKDTRLCQGEEALQDGGRKEKRRKVEDNDGKVDQINVADIAVTMVTTGNNQKLTTELTDNVLSGEGYLDPCHNLSNISTSHCKLNSLNCDLTDKKSETSELPAGNTSYSTASKDCDGCDVSPKLKDSIDHNIITGMSEQGEADVTSKLSESPKRKRRRRKKKKTLDNSLIKTADDKTDLISSNTGPVKVRSQTDINVRLSDICMNYNIPQVKRNRFSKPVNNKHTHFAESGDEDDGNSEVDESIPGEDTPLTSGQVQDGCRTQHEGVTLSEGSGAAEVSSNTNCIMYDYNDAGHSPSSSTTEQCLSTEHVSQSPYEMREPSLQNGAKVFTRHKQSHKLRANSPRIYQGFSKQQQLSTPAFNRSTILHNTNMNGEAEQIELVPVMKSYDKFPPLNGPPRVGDTIAYKTLELTEEYCPEVSGYKEATVLSYDAVSQTVTLKQLGPPSNTVTSGKFDISIEDEEHYLTNKEEPSDEKTLQLSLLLETRLLV